MTDQIFIFGGIPIFPVIMDFCSVSSLKDNWPPRINRHRLTEVVSADCDFKKSNTKTGVLKIIKVLISSNNQTRTPRVYDSELSIKIFLQGVDTIVIQCCCKGMWISKQFQLRTGSTWLDSSTSFAFMLNDFLISALLSRAMQNSDDDK